MGRFPNDRSYPRAGEFKWWIARKRQANRLLIDVVSEGVAAGSAVAVNSLAISRKCRWRRPNARMVQIVHASELAE
jgi:hypothetical protein